MLLKTATLILPLQTGRYVGYYWGTDADTLAYAATNAKIEGNGQYTVALDATTNGYNQTTGYSDMQGLTFAAVIVKTARRFIRI